jgi:hypothetical protein
MVARLVVAPMMAVMTLRVVETVAVMTLRVVEAVAVMTLRVVEAVAVMTRPTDATTCPLGGRAATCMAAGAPATRRLAASAGGCPMARGRSKSGAARPGVAGARRGTLWRSAHGRCKRAGGDQTAGQEDCDPARARERCGRMHVFTHPPGTAVQAGGRSTTCRRAWPSLARPAGSLAEAWAVGGRILHQTVVRPAPHAAKWRA